MISLLCPLKGRGETGEANCKEACVLQGTSGEFCGYQSKKLCSCLKGCLWPKLQAAHSCFPVPTCKTARVSENYTSRLDMNKGQGELFARYAELPVVFWSCGKPCCDGDGKWWEQPILGTEPSSSGDPGKWQQAVCSMAELTQVTHLCLLR